MHLRLSHSRTIQASRLPPLNSIKPKMYALLLLGAVLVQQLVAAQGLPVTPIPVRVHFITQKKQYSAGDKTRDYLAPLCGGCAFDGLNALFGISLVNQRWNYDTGYYITVYAKDTAGDIIASNVNSSTKIPEPDFNFTYSAKYKNLFFHIETGPASSFVYTLSLTFDYKDRVYLPVPCAPRWQMTALENIVWQKYSEGNDTALLQPVFKTSTSQDVDTGEFKLFRLDYCFGDNLHYNITVTVITEDQKSGFTTYGCTKTYVQQHGKCDVRTPYRDISGGPVNVVQIHLDKPLDYGPVQVLVQGDGRFGQDNHFTLAASLPF